MLLAVITALLSISSIAATPALLNQVQTCLDVPQIPSPSPYLGGCKKNGPGPTYNTDRVRTNDPNNPNNQLWESWATLAPNRAVNQLNSIGGYAWVPKSTVHINPPAPPDTTPPVTPPTTGMLTLSWSAPTANTDGSALTNLAFYNVYQGTSPTSLTKLVTVLASSLTYITTALPVGTYYFAVTAVTSTGVESAQTQAVAGTIATPSPTVPNAPTNLKVVPNPSGASPT